MIGDKEIALTMTESHMLETFMKNKGHTVSMESLAESIWGTDYPGSNEAIHVYIRRLRQKVEADPSNPQIILTIPGIGYSLQITS